ncbi:pyridoxine 5'-phosphate synthase [Candidatus Endobugula sertula]|uniref:Pyridoxine 5'-phosphate synthase n=1 Tax=Candidatus Endobugula sertula TaxID=62101 RepID=A0A1D2QR60_9GAMM|nr:pyridoxine 5'-phosphate synthase [Candidatus Endobugula sertula]
MSTALSVNLNKIALLRNSREGNYPNVVTFAQQSIDAGVQGITVHPRPDQRHIRPSDVKQLTELLKQHPGVEFNIEGNPFAGPQGNYPGFMALIDSARPHQATLVPDSDEQLTSDHGFDVFHHGERLLPIIEQLKQWNIRISLFMDPDIQQIKQAKSLSIDRIELYTGPYAKHFGSDQQEQSLASYREAALYAQQIGLEVNAGHDLNLENLGDFLSISNIAEVSIGHALTVDALHIGYKNAVYSYSKICKVA